MDQLLQFAEQAGMSEEQGKTATGGIFGLLQNGLSEEQYGKLKAEFPEADQLAANEAAGGGGGNGGRGDGDGNGEGSSIGGLMGAAMGAERSRRVPLLEHRQDPSGQRRLSARALAVSQGIPT